MALTGENTSVSSHDTLDRRMRASIFSARISAYVGGTQRITAAGCVSELMPVARADLLAPGGRIQASAMPFLGPQNAISLHTHAGVQGALPVERHFMRTMTRAMAPPTKCAKALRLRAPPRFFILPDFTRRRPSDGMMPPRYASSSPLRPH